MIMGQFNPRHQGLFLYGGLILIGLPLAPTWQPLAFLLAGVLVGLGSGITEIMWDVQLQNHVAAGVLGRVYSLYLLGVYALVPPGLWLAGVVSDNIGPTWAFLDGGLFSVLLGVVAIGVRGYSGATIRAH